MARKAHPKPLPLRTIDDLTVAHEWLFNQQRSGIIDAKSADALNTTLKGATYLNGKLKIDYAKLWMMAQIKKIALPPALASLLPGGRTKEESEVKH
jgi:hypothetical protein